MAVYALDFDGGDELTIPNSELYSWVGDQGCNECWFKSSTSQNIKQISSKEEVGAGGIGMVIYPADRLHGLVTVPAGSVKLSGSTPLNDGAWHHLAVDYDSSKLRIFVDGIQEGIADASGNIVWSSNALWGFGYREHYSDRWIVGILDEIRISKSFKIHLKLYSANDSIYTGRGYIYLTSFK